MEGKRRALKQKSSHASARVVPTHIRVFGTNLTKEKRTRIRQELGKKLGKFASAIERVSVRVKDVNGPRGGIDQLFFADEQDARDGRNTDDSNERPGRSKLQTRGERPAVSRDRSELGIAIADSFPEWLKRESWHTGPDG